MMNPFFFFYEQENIFNQQDEKVYVPEDILTQADDPNISAKSLIVITRHHSIKFFLSNNILLNYISYYYHEKSLKRMFAFVVFKSLKWNIHKNSEDALREQFRAYFISFIK